MLERDTTFIIGAGASFDLGFPLGDTLRDRIIEVLAPEQTDDINFRDEVLNQILEQRSIEEAGRAASMNRKDSYVQAARTIRAGLPFARSIDTFIDGLRDREHIEFLSKLAIATVILRAEEASPLFGREIRAANAAHAQIRADRIQKLLGSWHTELSQILYDGHSLETLPHVFEHASFIVFNYDRCLEEFLSISLMNRFAIGRGRARELVGTCRIIHPYGQVGGFHREDEDHIPFGQYKSHDLVAVASRIRTFTETMESGVGEAIKDRISFAEVLVFVGFGWLPQNMTLLQSRRDVTHAQRVFATTFKLAAGEIAVVRDQINRVLRRDRHAPNDPRGGEIAPIHTKEPQFIIEPGDCKSLMQNCWLRLTQG
jgi:hypothetical protein